MSKQLHGPMGELASSPGEMMFLPTSALNYSCTLSPFLHKRQIHKGLVIQQAFFQVCSLL